MKCHVCGSRVVFLFYRKSLSGGRRSWIRSQYCFCRKCKIMRGRKNHVK